MLFYGLFKRQGKLLHNHDCLTCGEAECGPFHGLCCASFVPERLDGFDASSSSHRSECC